MREQQHDQGQKPPGQHEQSGSQRGQQSGSRQDQMKKQPSVDKSDKASFGDARKDAKFPEDDKSTK